MQLGLLLFLRALQYFSKFYFLLLCVRVILYWFPNISFYRQPWYGLIRVTDPYLKLFRSAMPPIFGLDISSIFAFLLVQVIIELAPRVSIYFFNF
jgi:YggT family protein